MKSGTRFQFFEDHDNWMITKKVNDFIESIEIDHEIIDVDFKTASLSNTGYFCVMITYIKL